MATTYLPHNALDLSEVASFQKVRTNRKLTESLSTAGTGDVLQQVIRRGRNIHGAVSVGRGLKPTEPYGEERCRCVSAPWCCEELSPTGAWAGFVGISS